MRDEDEAEGSATARPPGSLIDRLLSSPDHVTVEEANLLVLRLARSVTKSLPPLAGTTWNVAAIEDLVNEVWAEDIVFRCAQRAGTDKDFKRMLKAAVHNMTVDSLRKEDDLPIRERVQDVLDEGPFICEMDAYGLDGFEPGRRYQDDERELVRVANLEHLPLIYQRPDAKKRSPFAKRADLERVLTKVLTFAAAFVMLNSLTAVIKARLNRSRSFVHVEWTFDDEERSDHAERDDSQPEATVIATEIWASLTKDEKVAVAYINLPTREAAAKMGVKSPTTASKRIASVRAELEEQLTGMDELQPAIVAELLRLHGEHWTEPADASLVEGEDTTNG